MTVEQLTAVFENNDHYLRFQEIPASRRLSNRPDLHAFILLDQLLPDDSDIVVGADHDVIYLGVDFELLAPKLTMEQALDLKRCGVRYKDDGLEMYA